MRVLFIGPLPEPVTGMAVACQLFLDELVKHYTVDVIDTNKKEFKQGLTSAARIGEILRVIVATWRRRRVADVIYFTVSQSFAGNVKDLLIYLVCFGHLSKMVIHLHGGEGMRGILLRPHPLRRLNEFFLGRMGGVIVLGERLVGLYSKVVAPERIHIVPNCAEDYLFTQAAAIESKFSHTTPLRILFLSNLIPGKGYLELVDAFFALAEETKATVVIDFAGGFESAEQKRAFLQRIENVPQLRYHGSARGVARKELFHQAHVFCLPTYYPYEGQPLSILEAYAGGCAVITTDHSGIYDVFSPEINGLVVLKKSAPDLAAAIGRAVAAPEMLRRMAITNLRTAENAYRTSHYTANMLRVIDGILPERITEPVHPQPGAVETSGR